MNTANSTKRRHALQALTLLAIATIFPSAHAEDGSVFLVVTHKVQDFERWKPVYDSTAAWKPGFGWKQGTVFAIDGDRNNVMVMEEFSNMEQAKAFASSPELKAAMGKAGVMGPPEVRFVNTLARSKN